MIMEQARIADLKLKYIKQCVENEITPDKSILEYFDGEIKNVRKS